MHTRNTGVEWCGVFFFTQYARLQVCLTIASLSQVSTLYTVLILDGAPNQDSHQAIGSRFTLSPTVPPRRKAASACGPVEIEVRKAISSSLFSFFLFAFFSFG